MPVRPSCATAPGWSGLFNTRPPAGPPSSASVEGCAAESTPDGETASFTTAIAAFTVP